MTYTSVASSEVQPPGYGYVALATMRIGGGDRGERRVQPGDLLHPSEAGPSSNIDHLVLAHKVAKLPNDRGVLAIIRVLLDRNLQLEARLARRLAAQERFEKWNALVPDTRHHRPLRSTRNKTCRECGAPDPRLVFCGSRCSKRWNQRDYRIRTRHPLGNPL